MKKIHKHYKGYANRIGKRIHVAYSYPQGFGSIELTIGAKVTVEEMKAFIEKKNSFENVVILSWQLVKGDIQ